MEKAKFKDFLIGTILCVIVFWLVFLVGVQLVLKMEIEVENAEGHCFSQCVYEMCYSTELHNIQCDSCMIYQDCYEQCKINETIDKIWHPLTY